LFADLGLGAFDWTIKKPLTKISGSGLLGQIEKICGNYCCSEKEDITPALILMQHFNNFFLITKPLSEKLEYY